MTFSKPQQEPLCSHSRKGREGDAVSYYSGNWSLQIASRSYGETAHHFGRKTIRTIRFLIGLQRLLFKHGGLLPAHQKFQSHSICCAIFGSGLEDREGIGMIRDLMTVYEPRSKTHTPFDKLINDGLSSTTHPSFERVKWMNGMDWEGWIWIELLHCLRINSVGLIWTNCT